MSAIVDTHPQGGDAQQAPFMGSGGAEGNRPNPVAPQPQSEEHN